MVCVAIIWPLQFERAKVRDGFQWFFFARGVGCRGAAGGIVLTRPGQDPSYGLSPDDPYDAIDRLPADRA